MENKKEFEVDVIVAQLTLLTNLLNSQKVRNDFARDLQARKEEFFEAIKNYLEFL